jgi:1-acyl-sn-glycerol-3-phosphate acyltransferase
LNIIRALLFYAGYATITIVWGTLSVLIAWALPLRVRFKFIVVAWSTMVLGWLRLTCGISFRVHGRENLPDEPCVVFVKHESTWETLFMQRLFVPQATLIKRELLYIPFFGWAFWLLRPIAIDRSSGRKALKSLIDEGSKRLASSIWVVLFPEGTRTEAGVVGDFQIGGAALVEATGTPVLMVAHNAGRCWPAHKLAKHRGIVDVVISEPLVTTGKNRREINELTKSWMVETMSQLDNQTSKFATARALDSMNSRLGST